MRRVVIVDQKDIVIGAKTYGELEYNDIYRVAALWLTDKTTGECLLTQRKWSKHNDPGKWMAAASGTVEEGEEYEENIVKEIAEEIGLTNLDLQLGPKEYVDDGKNKFFVQWFTSEVIKKSVTITIQEDEVESYKWVSIENLLQDVGNNPDNFVPSMRHSLQLLGILNEQD